MLVMLNSITKEILNGNNLKRLNLECNHEKSINNVGLFGARLRIYALFSEEFSFQLRITSKVENGINFNSVKR